ncbi:MAG: terminase small subunit [Methyloprofundus sp.]|nr:terminase small subunit [Methyloprofundus sp.]
MADLTPKQEKFAQLYVEMGNATQAYREAYDTESPDTVVNVDASRALKHPKISLRIAELQEAIEEKALWRRINSVRVLSDIALGGEKDSDRVSAVKALNAMHGWDKQVIDHTSSDGSLAPTRIELVAPGQKE